MSATGSRRARHAVIASEKKALGLRNGYPVSIMLVALIAATSTASALSTLFALH